MLCSGSNSIEKGDMVEAFPAAGFIEEVPAEGPGLDGQQRHRHPDFPMKHTAIIVITVRCNLKCRHYYQSSDAEKTVDNNDLSKGVCG